MLTTTDEVRIENSTHCNQECRFCPHSTGMFTRQKMLMPMWIFNMVLEKMEELRSITDVTVSGFGEPTTDGLLRMRIKALKERGYKVHVLTNGTYALSQEIRQLVASGLDSLRFSYHKDIEWKIDEAIRIAKDSEVEIMVSAIAERVENLSRLKNKYGGVCLEVWEPHNWVRSMHYRNGEMLRDTCGRPLHGPIQVQVDGTVNMCCFDYNGELLLGDLKKQSFEEIFQSKEINHIRKHHADGSIGGSGLLCDGCDQLGSKEGVLVYSNRGFKNRVDRVSTTGRKV